MNFLWRFLSLTILHTEMPDFLCYAGSNRVAFWFSRNSWNNSVYFTNAIWLSMRHGRLALKAEIRKLPYSNSFWWWVNPQDDTFQTWIVQQALELYQEFCTLIAHPSSKKWQPSLRRGKILRKTYWLIYSDLI